MQYFINAKVEVQKSTGQHRLIPLNEQRYQYCTLPFIIQKKLNGSGNQHYLSHVGRFSYGILIRKSEHCSLINLPTASTNVM